MESVIFAECKLDLFLELVGRDTFKLRNIFAAYSSVPVLQGLSVRSVLFSVFQSVIVFLYICDNDTSWIVKMSVGVGLLIELWKIPKCVNINVSFTWSSARVGYVHMFT